MLGSGHCNSEQQIVVGKIDVDGIVHNEAASCHLTILCLAEYMLYTNKHEKKCLVETNRQAQAFKPQK